MQKKLTLERFQREVSLIECHLKSHSVCYQDDIDDILSDEHLSPSTYGHISVCRVRSCK